MEVLCVYRYITGLLLCLPFVCFGQKKELKAQLQEEIAGKKAQIGIAVIINHEDTVTVNNGHRYPMMSVFKLHQALSVADHCQRKGMSLDAPVFIRKEDLKPDTYSPLRDRYPEGNVSLSVRRLLEYTLHLSDNNACDILFGQFGGTKATDRYIRSLGLHHFSIEATEDEMHKDLSLCYRNWSTPLETARLIELLLNGHLFENKYQDFLLQTMISCQTGKDRLVAPLQATGAVVGHKTGTGDRNEQGELIGINDVGFVRLPDGTEYTIAVFVKDSAESAEDTAGIIARISEIVYHCTMYNRKVD